MFDVVPYDDIIRQGMVGSKLFCSSTGSCNEDGLLEYQRMADALVQVRQSTGTQFVFSLCEWGMVSLESLFFGIE
jgi:alpha-galactosidase